LNRNQDAILEYKKVLNLNSFNYRAHNNLGVIYAKEGMYELAIEEFKKSLEINANNTDAFDNLSRCYKLLAQKEKQTLKK
jgi:Flp pilus assembly protein TadD